MQLVHNYGSGFLFLTVCLTLPGVCVLLPVKDCFSLYSNDFSCAMTVLLTPALRERIGKWRHTEKQTT